MHVVGHQAVAPHPQAVRLRLAREDGQVCAVVIISEREQNLLSLVEIVRKLIKERVLVD